MGVGDGAITVGDAVWNITADSTQLDESLGRSRDQMEQTGGFFERNTTRIGAAIGAAGAAITGVMAKATSDFADSALEMARLQDQTQFATEELSSMVRVFENAGLTSDNLGRSVRNVQREIAEVIEAGDAAGTSLGELGLTFEDLQGLAPEEQFMRVVEALEGVEDANLRTAAASDIFRGQAENILRVIGETEGEFRRLVDATDAAFDDDDLNAAREYDAAMDDLSNAVEDLWNELGRALLPALTDLVESLNPIIEGIREWIDENPELTQTIIKVTAAIGGIMAVLGPLIILLPGLKVAFAGVGVAIAALSGPIGIIVAAIAGLIAIGIALWTNWEEVVDGITALWEGFKDFFSNLWDTITDLVRNAIRGVGEFIGSGMRAVVDAVMDPIGTLESAWQAIVDIFNDALAAIGRALGWISDLIGGALGLVGDFVGLFGEGFAEGFATEGAARGMGGAVAGRGTANGGNGGVNINVDMNGARIGNQDEARSIGQEMAEDISARLTAMGFA